MNVIGPERFTLNVIENGSIVRCSRGLSRFSGIATSKRPKIYIASLNGMPIYIGQTTQSMGTRIRMGWSANGQNGYHGYAWRRQLGIVHLDIWEHQDAPSTNVENRGREMET